MKLLLENDTIQIEVTNYCINRCANCTRFVNQVKNPYFMTVDKFREAVDSMAGFPNMVGMTGGEPLLHPNFPELCKYMSSKFPKEQLGLWTCLPEGYEHYHEIIVSTFANIFVNDHTRNDIYHHPFLVAAKDVLSEEDLYITIDKCFFQSSWSVSINPRGAFFCEIAASFSMLYPELSNGWNVDKGWWRKTPKDYSSQIEEYCQYCGGCLFLHRRLSVDKGTMDVSKTNLEKLREHGISTNKCVEHDCIQINPNDQEPLAAYKDQNYRNVIASRYGMFLVLNEKGFNTPYLKNEPIRKDSILNIYKDRYK